MPEISISRMKEARRPESWPDACICDFLFISQIPKYLSLRGRRFKREGKGSFGKGSFRRAPRVSLANSLSLPFQTPATQAINICAVWFLFLKAFCKNRKLKKAWGSYF